LIKDEDFIDSDEKVQYLIANNLAELSNQMKTIATIATKNQSNSNAKLDKIAGLLEKICHVEPQKTPSRFPKLEKFLAKSSSQSTLSTSSPEANASTSPQSTTSTTSPQSTLSTSSPEANASTSPQSTTSTTSQSSVAKSSLQQPVLTDPSE